MKPNEVLTEVAVPAMKPGHGACYLKHRHPASSYAVVGVAAYVSLRTGSVASARLAVGGVSETPKLLPAVELALKGESPTPGVISSACERVAEAFEFPLGDIYASAEYRMHLATVLSRRALAEAFKRAKKQK